MVQPATSWNLAAERGPQWLFIRFADAQDYGGDASRLAEDAWQLVSRHFIYRVVIELDDVTVLDSVLLDQLAQLRDRIREHGGLMRICGLSPFNRRVLEEAKLCAPLPHYATRHEAVLGCAPRKPK